MSEQKTAYHHGDLAQALLIRAAEVIDESGIEALTLRGLARDLGVSHGAPNRHFKNKAALLSALATEGWLQIRDATLSAADLTGSDNAHIRLNAMGRGYLRWALANQALYKTIYHPDVSRYATAELRDAIDQFAETVRDAVKKTQVEGRHSDLPLNLLTLFTNSVPTGAAMLLINRDSVSVHDMQFDETLIEEVINLVVPLPEI